MKKLLPIILAVIGLGAGVGIGLFLKPAPEMDEESMEMASGENCAPEDMDHGKCPEPEVSAYAAQVQLPAYDPDAVWEYVKMPKQFVVPVIKNDRVSSLVVMTISLEVTEGNSDGVLSKSPKLRDSYLQVMFSHANSGGFDGAFTTGQSMRDLRASLLAATRSIVGDVANDVLIEEIVKQTM